MWRKDLKEWVLGIFFLGLELYAIVTKKVFKNLKYVSIKFAYANLQNV